MTEKNPPYVLQNRTDHKSDQFRLMLSGLTGRAEGVFGPSDLAVTQDTGANMNSKVAVGGAFMFGDESITQGEYMGYNDAAVNLTHAAAPGTPGQSRYDMVCARTRDAVYSGATNAWDLFINQGTAAASPAEPTTPSNVIVLARVTVAFGQTTITNANIVDRRPRLPQGVFVVNSARRPGIAGGPLSINSLGGPAQAAAAFGQVIAESDTYQLLMYTTSTTGWRAPWNLPWGELYQATSSGTSAQASGISGESVIFTSSAVYASGRRIRIRCRATARGSDGYYLTGQIRRTNVSGTVVGRMECTVNEVATFGAEGAVISEGEDHGGSTSQVYVATFDTGDIYQPYQFTVDDMGPAANPT